MSAADSRQSMHAGFGTVDITPKTGDGLWWVVGNREATGVLWPLKGRVALFDDGDARVAVVALDLATLGSAASDRLRAAVAAGGGLNARDVFVNSSHAHNTPIEDWGPLQPSLIEPLAMSLGEAAAEAAARMESVEICVGKTTTEGLTFSRRPIYTEGAVASGGPPSGEGFMGFEGTADEELQVLACRRPDGTFAGGLVNFACHPHIMGPEPVWSADFPGALAEMLTERHGGTFLFLQGASGDLHWVDRAVDDWWTNWWVDPERLAEEPRLRAKSCVEAHARGLLAATELCLSACRPIARHSVAATSRTLKISRRVPSPEQLQVAERTLAREPRPEEFEEINRGMSGQPFLFYEDSALIQGFLARLAVAQVESDSDASGPGLEDAEVQVVRLGDMALVGYPGEMFCEFSLRTKADSPFNSTFVCGLTNGSLGYIPTLEAFERGGYEPRIGANRVAPDAGDQMVTAALALLHE